MIRNRAKSNKFEKYIQKYNNSAETAKKTIKSVFLRSFVYESIFIKTKHYKKYEKTMAISGNHIVCQYVIRTSATIYPCQLQQSGGCH